MSIFHRHSHSTLKYCLNVIYQLGHEIGTLHLSCSHRISGPAHHLKRTENKPFSGLIGSRHITTGRKFTHENWVTRCFSQLLQFNESNLNRGLYIWPSFSRDHFCKVKAGFMVWEDKYNIFFFLIGIFILKCYAPDAIFTKTICIWKRQLFLEETQFNV